MGPLVQNLLPVELRTHALRAAYSGVKIVQTLDVLDWLEHNGGISRAQHLEVLTDLVQHRRAFAFSPELLASAAARSVTSADEVAVSILSDFGSLPSHLAAEAIPRFAPVAMARLSRAVEQVWFNATAEATRKSTIESSVSAEMSSGSLVARSIIEKLGGPP